MELVSLQGRDGKSYLVKKREQINFKSMLFLIMNKSILEKVDSRHDCILVKF